MIKYNNSNINGWNFDDSNIVKVYHNGAVCYYKIASEEPPTPPAFEGKYKLTLSDSSTVSADCDSTSAITQNEVSRQYSGSVVSAVIGDCVTSIGNSAFYRCRSLTSVTIPDCVTSINNNAFYYCSSLTSINIPNSVTSINNNAFRNCSSLASCTIGTGVTSIGNSTFNKCSSLTSITIPDCITSIGKGAFYHCSSLTSITCLATTPPSLEDSLVFFDTHNCPIYVPSGSVETYKTAENWSTYASRIQAITNS